VAVAVVAFGLGVLPRVAVAMLKNVHAKECPVINFQCPMSQFKAIIDHWTLDIDH
jgi:hypothetical protein